MNSPKKMKLISNVGAVAKEATKKISKRTPLPSAQEKIPKKVRVINVGRQAEENVARAKVITKTANTVNEETLSIRVLSQLLDAEYYNFNFDVKSAGISPTDHFEKFGRFEQREISIIFDRSFLEARASQSVLNELDGEERGIEARKHFSEPFFADDNESLMPNRWLDFNYLRANNPGFETARPIELIFGLLNSQVINVHPLFDQDFYLRQVVNIGSTINMAPICHYLCTGWKLGLDPHPLFDSWFFHENNAPPGNIPPLLAYLNAKNTLDLSIGPFVDEKYLNHRIAFSKFPKPADSNSLAHALSSPGINFDVVHPHLTNSIVDYIKNGSEKLPHEISLTSPLTDLANIVAEIRVPSADLISHSGPPKVSIIIVNYRKPVLTMLSVYSAIKSLQGVDYEILLVDNDGSAFQNEILYRYFQSYPTVRILTTTRNLYFGEGNNIAIDKARGEIIWFLNNDAFIDARSARELIAVLDENPEFGAVGPVMIDAGLTIGEAGGVISRFGEVVQQGKGRKYSPEIWNLLNRIGLENVDYVSAACLLVRAELLRKYGGFDYSFEPFYYEDTDLCLRIAEKGSKVALLGQAICLHLENTTTKEFLGDKFGSIVSTSREKFFSRWVTGDDTQRGIIDCTNIGVPTASLRTMAIYTPFHVNLGGGENYVLSLAAAASKDFAVTFITDSQTSISRFAFVLRDLAIPAFNFAIATRDEVQGKQFDLAISMGNEIIPPWVPPANAFIYHCQFPFPINHSTRHYVNRNQNISAFLVNSKFTAEAIANQAARYKLESKEIFVLSPPVNTAKITLTELLKRKIARKDKKITFASVGRYFAAGHCKRQDVIAHALTRPADDGLIFGTIFGGLSDSASDQEFYNRVKSQEQELRLVVGANVSRHEIEETLEDCNYYIHAAGLGVNSAVNPHQCEHFGITVVEAMANGCIPIVYSEGGPAEIVRAAGVGYLYSSATELFTLVSMLAHRGVSNEDYLKDVAKAHQFAQRYSRETFYSNARKIFLNFATRENIDA